jgi:molybdopterin converting factor small subunit
MEFVRYASFCRKLLNCRLYPFQVLTENNIVRRSFIRRHPRLAAVNILYFGPLYEIVGKRKEKVEVSPSLTLAELLEGMRKSHGQKFSNFVFDSKGKIRSSIAFAVDGESISKSQLNKIGCGSVKEFVILPPISGG